MKKDQGSQQETSVYVFMNLNYRVQSGWFAEILKE